MLNCPYRTPDVAAAPARAFSSCARALNSRSSKTSRIYWDALQARLIKKGKDVEAVWLQTTDEITVGVVIADDIKGADVAFEIHPTRMRLAVRGEMVLEGDFNGGGGSVVPDGSFFTLESKDDKRMCVLTLEKKDMGHESWNAFFEEEKLDATVTQKVYMDVAIGDAEPERITFGLYGNEVPKTVENFRSLCTGERGDGEAGVRLAYAGSFFHRIISGFMAQGGDFTKGDGTGGESIYGRTFQDERLRLKHDRPGLLSMANAGPDTNGSQFFVTFVACPHLDGNHEVFGEVLDGLSVVNKIEVLAGSPSGEPKVPVKVVACGEL